MRAVERVGIKNLKNKLSTYIRQVRRGVRILVTDRDEVVAEIRPSGGEESAAIHPLLAEWVRSGKVQLPTKRSRKPLPASPVRLTAGTAQRLLDEDRGE